MRNTSDPIKENLNVMNTQGGEKKVMKKILSVALSTAMAFSMFASVAFGDTAVSPQQQFDALKAKGIFNGYPDGTAGLDKEMTRAEFAKVITKLLGLKEITGQLSYTDKNYTAKNWAVPYIEAVTAAGIMEGKNVEKKIFDFNGKVTVAEMATILTRALDLEVPAETDNTAPAWAKGYVQAAINAGLVDAKANFSANASRELLVGAAYAVDQAQSLKVTKYEVSEAGKVVTFTISDGETVKVTLDKALEANKETEVKFTYKDKQFTEKVTYVVEAATKVQSASSVNLKEVDVAFDGKVDKATATDKNNYTVDSNSKGIKSITLLADGKTARLLLNESSKFTQGTTYKVAVKNVKSSTGTVLPQGEVSFTSADNTLPTVTEVKALGTKVIKVTFSEPVVAPSSSNFQLDDKAFVGSVTQGANQREVILRDYTGSISEGAHKLTTSLVEDYAGLKSLAATNDFTVVADTEGPKVTEVSATLEKVTVTFDEEIDPASVTNDSFYWKSGDSKKTGTVTQVSSNVYEVDFTANRLPGYETTLFVEVKDYSGNANATKEHKITATVDLVQPRVVEVAYGTNNPTQLTVRFDKAVTAADRKYFTIKKGDDVIPVREVTPADGSGKIFNLSFYSTLANGTYNIKIAGVQDTTALKNTLVEYNGTFVASDSNAPALKGVVDANNTTRKVTLNFDRELDLSTLGNSANYLIDFQKANSSTVERRSLPVDVQVRAIDGGKGVVLQFPEFIDGTRVNFDGSVKKVYVSGLKAKTGQGVTFADYATTVTSLAVNKVSQSDAKTFVLEFNTSIANASVSDFQVGSVYPSSVTVDGNKVTLKTGNTEFLNGANVKILPTNRIETYSGNTIGAYDQDTQNTVAPKVVNDSDVKLQQIDRKVELTFSQKLFTSDTVKAEDFANDLIINKLGADNTPKLNPKQDYKTSIKAVTGDLEGKVVVIEFLTSTYNDEYSIKVKKDAEYIRSAAGDHPAATESSTYTTTGNGFGETTGVINATSSAFVADAGKEGKQATITKDNVAFTAKQNGTAANGTKIEFVLVTDQNNPVVVKDGKVNFKAGATSAEVVAAVNDAGLDYRAAEVDAANPVTVTAGTVELAGGEAAVGKVVVALDAKTTKVANVTVDGKSYTGTDVVVASDGLSFTVNVGSDAVIGKKVTAQVTSEIGRVSNINRDVTAN
ncbi:S-layer homology domain-containing protein [Paenibacillus silvae]|uniref:S-layer homology domain-containing protein n=1 Tax=Paenibacillus silvae TaxID=1325358 RepID=UPI0025A18472|nr:S-layer homology domain-containing protein [Paenibacillus silvae]MDM5281307.1 S-layer homology domain-containing protein [Paenibacillus silvae]